MARIEYKFLSPTYKVLTTTQPPYLHHLTSVQPPRSTRSTTNIILAIRRPITDRSQFRYASPCLWNQLPSYFRQPHFSPSVSALPVHAPTTSSHSVNSPLSPTITPSLFHSRLKTYLIHKYFPPYTPFQPQDWLHGLHDRTVSSEHLRFLFFVSSLFFLFGSVRQIKLATRQLLGAR